MVMFLRAYLLTKELLSLPDFDKLGTSCKTVFNEKTIGIIMNLFF